MLESDIYLNELLKCLRFEKNEKISQDEGLRNSREDLMNKN